MCIRYPECSSSFVIIGSLQPDVVHYRHQLLWSSQEFAVCKTGVKRDLYSRVKGCVELRTLFCMDFFL